VAFLIYLRACLYLNSLGNDEQGEAEKQLLFCALYMFWLCVGVLCTPIGHVELLQHYIQNVMWFSIIRL
jgi:hypothetical protein